ncbi:uncharacterized protein MELLADRAFT_107504 [Melampsora larici-populina 98AG31]|uniref:Uncharacterized protein n=1 Tax=Melampsora larici-populina (strain 98AG31 / pathotype 3-4-7) TaxID=747676 RepID=F4RQ10_MELLP|nr:uncharacterized protein MELLADRAFT_107504 [Melampsora larici-populina 98AG31]EGG05637.1 hypothetical protein MELLADRAFT_107504 [Melampsora larici-populina 98AG31]
MPTAVMWTQHKKHNRGAPPPKPTAKGVTQGNVTPHKPHLLERQGSQTHLRVFHIPNLKELQLHQDRRIDATSKTYHGTWGYVHFVNPELLTGLDPSLCTLPVLQKILKDDCERPVDSGELLRSKAQEVQGHENLESCCY